MKNNDMNLSTEQKLILLVLYAADGKLDWEKLKAAVIILLKAKEEGIIKI